MQNLWIFGDSYMSGHWTQSYIWPEQLAKKLNLTARNYALSGGSLPWMYHQFTKQIVNLSEGDYVIVGITNFIRQWFFNQQPMASSIVACEYAHLGLYEKIHVDKNQLDAVYKYYQYLDNPEDDHFRLAIFLHLLHLLTEKFKLKVLIIPCYFPEMLKYNEYKNHYFPLFNTINGFLEKIMINEYDPVFYNSIKIIDDKKPNHLIKSNHEILIPKLIEAFETNHLDLNPDQFVRGIITKSIFDDLGFLEAETIVNQPMQFKWK